MKYDTIFFDLDGTVTDSAPGILNSVEYALGKFRERYGRPKSWTRAELNCFIGPPLVESFKLFVPCTPEEAEECLKSYREYFADRGIHENSVYPGIPELLAKLRSAGVKVVLATAKPEVFARKILDNFNLTSLFDGIYGATLDVSRNRKAQVVAWALAHTKARGRTVMLGDRKDDVLGAAENGLETIGALWGYGSEEELSAAGAVKLCAKVEDVFDIIK